MTAFLLFVAFAAGLTAYVTWAGHAIADGAAPWWFVAGAPIAYFAPAVLLVTLWFALAWIWRTPRPPEAQLGIAATLRLYFVEIWTVGKSWLFMILHRLLIHDPPSALARRPVVLIHGVLVNDGVWMAIRRFLAQSGVAPIYTVNYGPPLEDIELFAAQLHERIERIRSATGAEQVALVAHSMGGLVARAYLRRFGGQRISRLITIGTPHHGSVLAYTFPGRCLAQMHPGNPWLVELNRGEQDASVVPIVSIWSRHDSMVVPQASAQLAGAENVAVVGVAHNALLGDNRVIELVTRSLR